MLIIILRTPVNKMAKLHRNPQLCDLERDPLTLKLSKLTCSSISEFSFFFISLFKYSLTYSRDFLLIFLQILQNLIKIEPYFIV